MSLGKIKPIFFLLPFVIISLLLGMDAGLIRMGWSIPVMKTAMLHGGLMIGSFLGTLIIIERIVAMKIRWLWAFPVVNVAPAVFRVVLIPAAQALFPVSQLPAPPAI